VVSVLGLLEPVVAMTLAWLMLGQSLTAVQLVGAGVLLCGATVVQQAARAPVVADLLPERKPAEMRA
jgi:drug/metabolite transporter (DMT)-like permease